MGKGIVKLGEGNWAVKDGNLLAAKETNGRFKNAEFTVTRGTDATYVGKDGLIKTASFYNLFTYSEDFSDSSWVKNGFGNALSPVVTLDTDISPDGTQNASRIEMDCTSTSSSDYSAIYQQLALDGSSEYTISFYVKSNTSYNQDLLFFINSSFSTQITAISEWQRVEFTFTSNSTNPRNFGLLARGNVQQDVDILIWGAQLVEGTEALDYQYTNGKEGIPRIDFTNNTDGYLLLEPESRNLYLNSEPTANEGAADNITYEPFAWDNGFTNCVRFGDNSSTTYRYGGTALANTTYTLSCYVIMDDLSKPVVSYGSLFGDNTNNSNFDFSFIIGGIINPVLEEDIKYEDCGNNIWKVSRKSLVGASSLNNNGIIKYTGQSSKGFRVVGWQLEALPYATSYIPTSGLAVTRDAETCTGAGEAIDFNSEEGVLYAEIAMLSENDKDSDNQIFLSNGSTNNRVGILINADGDIRAQIRDNEETITSRNVTILDQSESGVDTAAFNKIAILYKSGQNKLFVNGSRITDTNFDSFVFNYSFKKLNFDNGSGTANYFRGKVKAIRVYKEALGDGELVTLTSL